MSSFQIVTDTSSDLLPHELKKLGVVQFPIGLTIAYHDGTISNYPDYTGSMPTADQFYKLQASACSTSTGTLGPATIIDVFRPILQDGKDILYVGITQDMSEGVWNSLNSARQYLLEQFPGRHIELGRTHSISGGLGLFVDEFVKLCDSQNLTLHEALVELDKLAVHLTHLFTVNNYDYLKNTGRVSRFAAGIATALNLKPYMQLPYEGKMEATDKIRGDLRLLRTIADRVASTILKEDGQVWICYGAQSEYERATTLACFITACLPKACISYHRIGPIIGAHTGPTVLAAFFLSEQR